MANKNGVNKLPTVITAKFLDGISSSRRVRVRCEKPKKGERGVRLEKGVKASILVRVIDGLDLHKHSLAFEIGVCFFLPGRSHRYFRLIGDFFPDRSMCGQAITLGALLPNGVAVAESLNNAIGKILNIGGLLRVSFAPNVGGVKLTFVFGSSEFCSIVPSDDFFVVY